MQAIVDKESIGAAAYQTCMNTVCLFARPAGLLSIRGKDSLDFLNRLSTNDLRNLHPGLQATTVLTDERARIIDVITVVVEEEGIMLCTSAGNSLAVLEWLGKFVILEDIRLLDLSSERTVCSLAGPLAGDLLGQAFGIEPPTGQGGVVRIPFSGRNLSIYRDQMWEFPVYNVLLGREDIDEVRSVCTGAPQGGAPVGVGTAELFELLRIEQGVPKLGREITEHVNPLEAGFRKFISFDKGCYIGQEVVARLDTYKKVQKQLSGIILEAEAGMSIRPGKIFSDEKEIGFTTSHCYSLKRNKPIALGYLKTNISPENMIFKNDDAAFNARVSQLPF